jgi:Transposase DDE domain
MSLSPYHNGCQQLCKVVAQDMPWTQQVLSCLPSGYEQQARTYRAFIRVRGVRCAGDLLRGLFAYVFCFGSFRQLGCWASLSGLAQISERAWGKRVRRARLWMLWLLKETLGDTEEMDLPMPPTPWHGRILLIDSTSVRGRANEGYWRLHTSYDLLKRQIAQVCFADHHVAESLSHCTALPGAILVADRGYCKPPAMQRTLKAKVDIVVRLHWSCFPLYQQDGSRLDLLTWVPTLPSTPTECPVFLTPQSSVPLRLLAVRLSAAAAQRERARRRRKAQKHCSKLQASTLLMADWLLVLTSLDAQAWPLEQVLQLYRARWHSELVFSNWFASIGWPATTLRRTRPLLRSACWVGLWWNSKRYICVIPSMSTRTAYNRETIKQCQPTPSGVGRFAPCCSISCVARFSGCGRGMRATFRVRSLFDCSPATHNSASTKKAPSVNGWQPT